MLRRLARLLVFLAAVQILGGHWLALQSVAWIGMLASYSRGDTLVVALEKTLDGDHPCGLCKVVQRGQQEEGKLPMVKIVVKLDAVLGTVLRVPVRSEAGWSYSILESPGAARGAAPPTPPPQAV